MTPSQDSRETNARSRRQRLRNDTEHEIRDAARVVLARDGLPAVTMRAIADEVGITSPALYRYYDGHHEVLTAVCGDLFDELVVVLRSAGSPGDPGQQLVATCRAFRSWALDHRLEFALVFANPIPPMDLNANESVDHAGMQIAETFAALFEPLWQKHHFPIPDVDDIDPILRTQLDQHAHLMPTLPLGVIFVFVGCWTRLVGVVSAEVFGQLSWATEHTEPFFEDMLAEMMERLTTSTDLPRHPN